MEGREEKRGSRPAVADELDEEGAEHVDEELHGEDEGEDHVGVHEDLGGVGVVVGAQLRLDDVEEEVCRDLREAWVRGRAINTEMGVAR
jgi:hypothetical protein